MNYKQTNLPETNIAPENRPSQKERIVSQAPFFSGELLASGRVFFPLRSISSLRSLLLWLVNLHPPRNKGLTFGLIKGNQWFFSPKKKTLIPGWVR